MKDFMHVLWIKFMIVLVICSLISVQCFLVKTKLSRGYTQYINRLVPLNVKSKEKETNKQSSPITSNPWKRAKIWEPKLPPVSSQPPQLSSDGTEVTPKAITKDIMNFFNTIDNKNTKDVDEKTFLLSKNLLSIDKKPLLDGMHIITILFQSARLKVKASTIIPISLMLQKLRDWDREWGERDISTFVYGIRSLECVTPVESELLQFAALKISESKSQLSSSSAIGNALYGLQDITSGISGIKELCSALADKIEQYNGDLVGQHIGIGLYGLQGLSADTPEVRKLIKALANKIKSSETEFDAQALSNSLYGLQSMSSDYPEVLELISALAVKVSDSNPETLIAQAIGSALYGLQKLSSDEPEVRSLVATLAEKIDLSSAVLDAQAVGTSLYGLQRMKSNSPEVRAIVQAIANKLSNSNIEMDSTAIGFSLYGLHNMNSDSPQVKKLLATLAARIAVSKCDLSGPAIADSLYGLRNMKETCEELTNLVNVLGDRIDAGKGKLDAQEIANALNGLQSLSSDRAEVRLIVSKLADKLSRSKVYLRPQNIGRALLGFQRLSSDSPEVRKLVSQITKRIAESDRTPMTAAAISDCLYGLQGLTSDVGEVQNLISELSKKLSSTAAILSPAQIGKALFGLQGLSSSASIFEESAIGLDADEVQFLISTLWDKIKVVREIMPLSSIALGLQGMTLLKDPIAMNIKQYLYNQAAKLPSDSVISVDQHISPNSVNPLDIISAVRGLYLNNLPVPDTLARFYNTIEDQHRSSTIVQPSRQEKLISQKFLTLHPNEKKVQFNILKDGIRIDVFVQDINLAIELDGPSHKLPARARFDKERDEYMTKLGIEVQRIQINGLKPEDVAKRIDEIIVNSREKKADQEIQKLYSRK